MDEKIIEKPPVGLMPRWRSDELRRDEIVDAIARFIEVGKDIPLEWIGEYNEICKRLEQEANFKGQRIYSKKYDISLKPANHG